MNLGQFIKSIENSTTMVKIEDATRGMPVGKKEVFMDAIAGLRGMAYRAGQVEGPDMMPMEKPKPYPVPYAKIGPAAPKGDEGQEYDEDAKRE